MENKILLAALATLSETLTTTTQKTKNLSEILEENKTYFIRERRFIPDELDYKDGKQRRRERRKKIKKY